VPLHSKPLVAFPVLHLICAVLADCAHLMLDLFNSNHKIIFYLMFMQCIMVIYMTMYA